MKRSIIVYLSIIAAVGLGLYALLHLGAHLTPSTTSAALHPQAPAAAPSVLAGAASTLSQNAADPLGRLFLQLLIILGASHIVGAIFARFGQPAVVGEMAAGVLLGPSLFGWLAPSPFHFIFATGSLGALQLLSQVGVCLFMFAVGMELDVSLLRKKAHSAVVVSHSSIIIPYFLGVAAALALYRNFAQPGASFIAFALFLGISMSITAFPVLARILQERNLSQTPLGTAAIACAAVDDVTAWTILAFVVAIVRSTGIASVSLVLLFVGVFLLVMFYLVKPELPRWLGGVAALEQTADPGKRQLTIVILVVMGAALFTEIIGIHALFGAFLAGVIMPSIGDFRHKLGVRVSSFASVIFLPLFFAFTGLRTQLGLFQGWQDILICLGIVAIATLGKLGGTAVTARLTGMPWSESFQLGALMNTRGLMELIALNIGYDLGILSPRIFSMLVLMALSTTAMTGPLLTLSANWGRARNPALDPLSV